MAAAQEPDETPSELEDLRRQKNRLVEELAAARAEAEAAREQARRASHAKAAFLANMSHEIRTPLNGVMGMAQLLDRSGLNALQRNQVSTLLRSGELLMHLLNDLLDLAQVEAGQMEIVETPCDLRELVAETREFWAPAAAEQNLALEALVDDDFPVHVTVDAVRVRQVLSNLIGAVLKLTPLGGVTLALSQTRTGADPQLTFAVASAGADASAALFQAFALGDDAELRSLGGAGAGLVLCRRLGALMGGEVVADGQTGFRLNLPLKVAQAPAAAAPLDESRRLCVLAADDNPTNLLVLEQLLGALGYSIWKARDGREALEALQMQAFDLVLMDIQMPEMTGFEVLKAVRKGSGPNQHTPLIAVTADAVSAGPDRYLQEGFAGFVPKPLHVRSLVSAMMAAVANAPEDETLSASA